MRMCCQLVACPAHMRSMCRQAAACLARCRVCPADNVSEVLLPRNLTSDYVSPVCVCPPDYVSPVCVYPPDYVSGVLLPHNLTPVYVPPVCLCAVGGNLLHGPAVCE
jgi:hypothetical protein